MKGCIFAAFLTMEKQLLPYEIQIQGLDDKSYNFDFQGGRGFFEFFESEDLQNGEFDAKVTLVKSATMLQLDFDISAQVELSCDRSLEKFSEPIVVKEKYIYKFGDRYEVVSDDMEVVPFGISEINVAQHLYDYIALAVPVKRVHPSLRNENEDDEYIFVERAEKKEEKGKSIDPRWQALEGLKQKLEDK